MEIHLRSLNIQDRNLRLLGNTPAAEFITEKKFEDALVATFSLNSTDDLFIKDSPADKFLEVFQKVC